MGLASEGAQLIDFGLSTEVVETILHSRALSTRKLYVFSDGFSLHIAGLGPSYCPIGTVLELLLACFSTGLSPSTLKVYVAALVPTCPFWWYFPEEGEKGGDLWLFPPW